MQDGRHRLAAFDSETIAGKAADNAVRAEDAEAALTRKRACGAVRRT